MISRTKLALAASLATIALASQAHAAIDLTAGFNESPAPGATVENFNTTPANLALSNAQIVTGSQSGQYAAPWIGGPSGGPDAAPYLSVYGGGSATFTLANNSTYFGLLWGSVDTYNTVSLYNGQTLVGTVTGQDLVNLVNNLNTTGGPGDNTNWDYNGTVFANITSTVAFNTVVLTTGSNSFEVGSVAVSAVPLPAALPMFGAALAGVGGLGFWRRRKV